MKTINKAFKDYWGKKITDANIFPDRDVLRRFSIASEKRKLRKCLDSAVETANKNNYRSYKAPIDPLGNPYE